MAKRTYGKLVVKSADIEYIKDGHTYAYGYIAGRGFADINVLVEYPDEYDNDATAEIVGWCFGVPFVKDGINKVDITKQLGDGDYGHGWNYMADDLMDVCEDCLECGRLAYIHENIGVSAKTMLDVIDTKVNAFLDQMETSDAPHEPTVKLIVDDFECELVWGAETVNAMTDMLHYYIDEYEPQTYEVYADGNKTICYSFDEARKVFANAIILGAKSAHIEDGITGEEKASYKE